MKEFCNIIKRERRTVILFSVIAIVLTLMVSVSVVHGQAQDVKGHNFKPSDTHAAADLTGSTVELSNLFSRSIGIINVLIFLFFFWKLALFVLSKEEDKKAQAKDHLLWSVVGIAVFSTLWGAVAFLRNVTGIGDNTDELKVPDNVKIPGIIGNCPRGRKFVYATKTCEPCSAPAAGDERSCP